MDKNIYCMVIDDEPLARELLEKLIAKLHFLKLVATCGSTIEAIETLSSRRVDLLFLDIRMPELDGITFIRTLEDPPEVIFITAHEEYAVESYEINAIDYLVKPFEFGRFVTAVNKVLRRRSMYYRPNPHDPEKGDLVHLKKEEETIPVWENKKIIHVPLINIRYIKGLKDFQEIHCHHRQKPITTYKTLKEIESLLPQDRFIRIHRSYIVSKQAIEKVNRGRVILQNGERLDIGRTYKVHIRKLFSQGDI